MKYQYIQSERETYLTEITKTKMEKPSNFPENILFRPWHLFINNIYVRLSEKHQLHHVMKEQIKLNSSIVFWGTYLKPNQNLLRKFKPV